MAKISSEASGFTGLLLEQVGQDLQVIEVTSCSEGLGMGAREARRSWVVAGAEAGKRNGVI